jgi:hypothetical protein
LNLIGAKTVNSASALQLVMQRSVGHRRVLIQQETLLVAVQRFFPFISSQVMAVRQVLAV